MFRERVGRRAVVLQRHAPVGQPRQFGPGRPIDQRRIRPMLGRLIGRWRGQREQAEQGEHSHGDSVRIVLTQVKGRNRWRIAPVGAGHGSPQFT